MQKTVMGTTSNPVSQQITSYSKIPNNEIVTGFVVDFLRSLQLTRTLHLLETEFGVLLNLLFDTL